MSSPINIGVLFLPSFQLLDAAGPMDYINNHSKEVMDIVRSPLAAKAPIIKWHYISYTKDLAPAAATTGVMVPTCTYADCPKLDYLLIPGPDPAAPLPDGCAEFVKMKFAEIKVLLCVCTGSLAISQTGILDGYRVSTSKLALRFLSGHGHLRKEVKWVGDKRWVKDGKVWSAAGVTSGIDLAAEFARVHFDPELVEFTNLACEHVPLPDHPDAFSKMLEGVSL